MDYESEGSIILTKDIPAGTVIQKNMLGIDFSTDEGLSPQLLQKIINKKVIYEIKKGNILTFGHIR